MNQSNLERIIYEDAITIGNEPLNWNFLRDKKILITGGTGFIASYLIKVLFHINNQKKLNLKVDCTVRDLEKTKKIFNAHDCFKNFLTIKKISILDSIELDTSYNIIIHAASIASPKYFDSDPIGVVAPNTIGTVNLLKFAETMHNLDKFIFFSTTGVNGHVEDSLRPIPENVYGALDPTLIENCYLESKRMGENICFAWYKQKSVPIQVVRPAITYGPGVALDDGRSYADFINSIVKGQDIILHTDGSAIRNFCYIADFISGLMYVMLKGGNGEVYNLSSEDEYSIKQLANLLVNKIFREKNLSVVFKKEKDQFLRVNFSRTTVSTSKARSLGWNIKFDIENGMRRTIESYQ